MVKYPNRLIDRNTHGRGGVSALVKTRVSVTTPPVKPPVIEIPWTDLEPSTPIIKPPVNCVGALSVLGPIELEGDFTIYVDGDSVNTTTEIIDVMDALRQLGLEVYEVLTE